MKSIRQTIRDVSRKHGMPILMDNGTWVLRRPVDILRSKYGRCEDVVIGTYADALTERRANIAYDVVVKTGGDVGMALACMNKVFNEGFDLLSAVSDFVGV